MWDLTTALDLAAKGELGKAHKKFCNLSFYSFLKDVNNNYIKVVF